MAQALEALHSAAVAVWHLQRVLARKRDPLSHTLFAAEVAAAGAPQPLERFWCAAPRSVPGTHKCTLGGQHGRAVAAGALLVRRAPLCARHPEMQNV